jgi:hypothetical protein
MIQNLREPHVTNRLLEGRETLCPALSLLDEIAEDREPFALRLESPGLEFQALSPVGTHPNRAVLKIFRIDEGPLEGRTAVFFFKKSRIPWSHDRHSYGVCLLPPSGPTPGEVEEWIEFATTGFHPDHRPARLRQAFTFTVPE